MFVRSNCSSSLPETDKGLPKEEGLLEETNWKRKAIKYEMHVGY
ncbi:hypothetical protein KP509_34G003900 [Ceratopteris richardii]|uniref:Uncharacterized protein n=1 Tax=Ceratopteris richardii TaxID=49495 RepID=A0A8T2QI93_CERRI|nr:hypothetical protein KP509_34G003900 [Ceratopteris richardii]